MDREINETQKVKAKIMSRFLKVATQSKCLNFGIIGRYPQTRF